MPLIYLINLINSIFHELVTLKQFFLLTLYRTRIIRLLDKFVGRT